MYSVSLITAVCSSDQLYPNGEKQKIKDRAKELFDQ